MLNIIDILNNLTSLLRSSTSRSLDFIQLQSNLSYTAGLPLLSKIFITTVVVLLITSNNSIGVFLYSIILLASLCSILIIEGPEPLTYFFLIAEVSALFVIFLASISKKIKKRSLSRTFITPAIVLSLLTIPRDTLYSSPVFFKFNCSQYLNNSNDFSGILLNIYLKSSNISIIILLLLFMSLILISLLKDTNLKSSRSHIIGKSKINGSINNKIILNK